MVTIRQLEQLSKLEKEWASKRACIEGEIIVLRETNEGVLFSVDPFNLDHNLSNHLSVKSNCQCA